MKGKIAGLGVFLLVVGALLLASSLIIVPFATSEPFEVEKSGYLIDGWSFVLPALSHENYHRDISSGTKLTICFEVTNGSDLGVGFFVADEVNYWKWRAGVDANVYLSRSAVLTSLAINWTVSYDDTWYFTWYNKFDLTADKSVTVQITEYWTVTEYRDVTDYRPLIESQYAYGGIVILLVGVAVTVYGLIAKVHPPSTPQNNRGNIGRVTPMTCTPTRLLSHLYNSSSSMYIKKNDKMKMIREVVLFAFRESPSKNEAKV